MKISIIVAVADNGVIGSDNKLIWHLSDDLKNFKKITSGHFIIMGRRTYESIGKPLPNRTNIILSRIKEYKAEDCIVFESLDAALSFAEESGEEEVFIIGGEAVYNAAYEMSNKLYLTQVHASPKGDAFFKQIRIDQWNLISKIYIQKNERNDYDYEILELERRSR